MINFSIAIGSLIIAIVICYIEYRFGMKYIGKGNPAKYGIISALFVVLRFLFSFTCGFFLFETIKYFSGLKTLF